MAQPETRHPKADPLRLRVSAARRNPKPEIRTQERLTDLSNFLPAAQIRMGLQLAPCTLRLFPAHAL